MNGILGAKGLNDLLLLSIDPTGKDDQHHLPRLQHEFYLHPRLDESKPIVGVGQVANTARQASQEAGEVVVCGNFGDVPIGFMSAEMPGMRTFETLLLPCPMLG